ncbi:MAG: hypothetical protein EWV55_00935 [Microcystis viridis Mv_BB_P_19951000_S69]|uniref:Isopentenyl pyrophosphate isomerase n=1 Tax=Microcystis viridis Mv_BB_P_19951000_S68D TaxID=2486270 RepID=A0A552I1Q1_MICVR|nr:MAG: hypothetical protein EWV47_10625 [Microcystis viridis Mv_BB_P_19951000_S68]TRU77419.1 MAG: hypothetical protein EWV77_05860 [Microcystis viridis Mv_BB_P_19951000_S68D]TRU79338.1 MAG: hypothetical protein EWV55_00935 [Microcystis viridis Mv_BB_P_19951000_S69]TRU87896.1 MAG: hypothetical protein EWV46_07250 [Microcystis viridis Mv_BB_P_19951000_S69D]
MGKWGNGEMGKWGNGEMGKWGNGEMGKWGNSTKTLKPQLPTPITQHLTGLNVKLSIEERKIGRFITQ